MQINKNNNNNSLINVVTKIHSDITIQVYRIWESLKEDD